MSTFTSHDFDNLVGGAEQKSSQTNQGWAEVNPNFNGNSGGASSGVYTITAANELTQGLLFTALYGYAGPNTITIQFTAPLLAASTTAADYTLSGPSAPSITSVVWKNNFSPQGQGSREVLLNLSGPLSSVNTYTLAIAALKIQSGGQVPTSAGTFNWPNLVVDVILPATINCVGVGIEQDIVLGNPSVDTAGAANGVGIQQDVTLGTPVVNTLLSPVGVGIQQDIVLGDPEVDLFANCAMVGIAQAIALGTPVVTQQQEPVGVGIAQVIALGTPVADINPLTPTGVGKQQDILLGNPLVVCLGNVVGVGIQQNINLGTPTAHKDNTQDVIGVGINQIIDVGTPAPYQSATMNPLAFDQVIAVGTPNMSYPQTSLGVGIAQPIDVGTPLVQNQPFGIGIEVRVDFGIPVVGPPRPRFTTVPDLYPSVVQRWLLAPVVDGAVEILATVEQPLKLSTSVELLDLKV